MALEKDFELLDDYLGNRLDESARRSFEKQLNADPELKAELNVQQQMISGIKNARVAELKGMLNNIPVPVAQTTGSAVATKVASWVVVLGIVGTGIYLYLNNDTVTPAEQPAIEEQTSPAVKENEDSSEAETPAEKPHEDSPVVSSQESSSEQKPVSPAPAGKVKAEEGKKADPKIEVYDPTKEEAEEVKASEEIEGSKERPAPTVSVEIDSENKSYNFHYQFKDGKLFLYGPFEKNVYEIMEFFSEEKRTLFLYYGEQFYLLKDNSNKLKALTPIQDSDLLNKLKEYRNK